MVVSLYFKQHINFKQNFTNRVSYTVPVYSLKVSIFSEVKTELSKTINETKTKS